MKRRTEDLDALRAQVATLADERAELERETLDRDATLARIDAWIAEQASRCALDPRGFASPYGTPGPVRSYASASGDVPGVQHVDTSPVMCLLGPDVVRARLVELVDGAVPQFGRTLAERAARRTEIDAEIGVLERREEAEVRRLEATGRDVVRRVDLAHPILAVVADEALAA